MWNAWDMMSDFSKCIWIVVVRNVRKVQYYRIRIVKHVWINLQYEKNVYSLKYKRKFKIF